MATKEQLLAAGFTEEEILAEAGFSPEEIAGDSGFLDTASQYGRSLIKGVTDAMFSPGQEILSAMTGLETPAQGINKARVETIGNPEYKTLAGNVLGKVTELAPTAAFGGLGAILPTLAAGSAMGAVNYATPDSPLLEAGAGLVGGLSPTALKPMARGLGTAADRLLEKSIGAKVSDFSRSARNAGLWEGEQGELQTGLSSAIKEVGREGAYPAFRNPAKVATSVSDVKKSIGSEIENVVSRVDSAGGVPVLPEADNLGGSFLPSTPQVSFPRAQAIVSDPGRVAVREDLQKQLSEARSVLDEWDGRASTLQRIKNTLAEKPYNAPVNGHAPEIHNRQLGRAIERDLSEAIDNAVEARLSPVEKAQYQELKRRYSNYKKVGDVVDPAGISAQHAKIGGWQSGLWTTTGFGTPAIAAFNSGHPILGTAILTAGALSRTRAGMAAEAAIARGGSNAAALLSMIGDNPYLVAGAAIAPIPRDWLSVKEDEAAKEAIAFKMGLPVTEFNSLPEPMQKDLHAQAILLDPMGAEDVPGNYTIVDGKFMLPMEKDAYVRDSLEKSPLERARAIGASFENRYLPNSPQATPSPTPSPQIDLGSINNFLTAPPSSSDYSYDGEADKTIAALRRASAQRDVTRSGL